MTETTVEVGQVWLDNDCRGAMSRRVKVLAVNREPGREHALVENVATGRKTRIQLKRFRPTSSGYRLEGIGTWDLRHD